MKTNCKECAHYHGRCVLDDLEPCSFYSKDQKRSEDLLRIIVGIALAVTAAAIILCSCGRQPSDIPEPAYQSAMELLRKQHRNDLTEFDKLVMAISFTESRFNPDAVGMNNTTFIYRYKSGKECNGFIRTDSAIKFAAVDIESDVPRIELDRPHYAWINGKEYVAVKCTDKTSCKACEIFKLDPPRSMFQVPLCYEHNCGNHKIVDVCSRYKCIWKRKKNLQNK